MVSMIVIPAIAVSMLQASIAAPTDAFRGCLRSAADKASTEKVPGDKIEEYLRTSCTVQMSTLKDALVTFRMKNGMARKAAAADASMTVDDYLASPVDKYKFMYDRANAAAASPQPQKP